LLDIEHQLYPAVLQAMALNKLKFDQTTKTLLWLDKLLEKPLDLIDLHIIYPSLKHIYTPPFEKGG
jgi:hypothetical protein